jgi:hypothetical protein
MTYRKSFEEEDVLDKFPYKRSMNASTSVSGILHSCLHKMFFVDVDPRKAGRIDKQYAEQTVNEYIYNIISNIAYKRAKQGGYGNESYVKLARIMNQSQIKVTFPKNWSWQWNDNKQGRLTKRLNKLIADQFGLTLGELANDPYMPMLGERLAHMRYPEKGIYVDFTNNFDWYRGDFGDSGSCFWGDRTNARYAMQDNGFYALRVWKKVENNPYVKHEYEGYCRAWLAPNTPSTGCFTLFNFYGGMSQPMVYAMLSRFLGMKIAEIGDLRNNGSTSEVLYINGDHYAFYTPDSAAMYADGIGEIDLDVEVYWGDDDDYDDDDDDYDQDNDNNNDNDD